MASDLFNSGREVKLARLTALELGQARPDSALTAYLRVIDHAPDVVREALERT